MRGEKIRTWLPGVRLGAFLVVVVIVDTLFVQAFRGPASFIPQDRDHDDDSISGKIRRLDQCIVRVLERLIETPASACSSEQERMEALTSAPIENTLTMARPAGMLSPRSAITDLTVPELVVMPFAWPVPMTLPAGPSESFSPLALQVLEESDFRAALVTDLYRRCGSDPLADVGDVLLQGPMLLVDEVFTCMNRRSDRSAVRAWEDEENRSVAARMIDIQSSARKDRIFTVFMRLWFEREQKYLGSFEETRANTMGMQVGNEDAELSELATDQRKIVWDVLRRTYLAQYKMGSEERVRDETWYFGRWSGMDFAVLPPLIVGYLYYRGLDKNIRMGDMALRIYFEPVSEFVHRNRDRSVATALEWTVKGLPVGVIVTAGLHDGRYGLEFAGIGTSIAAVREAVDLQYAPPRP